MSRCVGGSMKVLTIVGMLGSLPAFAGSSLVVRNVEVVEGAEAFEGFSVGLDAVYSHLGVDRDGLEWGPAKPRGKVGSSDEQWTHSRCHIDPALNLGYSRVINNWYMGLAVDVAFGKSEGDKFKVDELAWASSTNGMSYGIKAKAGYYFSKLKSVVYGLAGVKWREIDFRMDDGAGVASKAKIKSPAFLVGAGIERELYKKFTVSAEYEYSWRNSSDTAYFKPDNGAATLYTDASQKLRDHTFKVGVKYHF